MSAFLQSIAIPNELFLSGFPFIAMFCLSPLYVSANKCNTYTLDFLIFAFHSFLVHIFSSFWLGFYRDFAIFTLGASALGTAFIGGVFGLFFYAGAARFAKSNFQKSSSSFRVIWFSAIWTSWEWLKSNFGFLSYPWGTLSMTAYKWTYLTQIADITGVYGITFLFSLSSALLGEFLLTRSLSKVLRPLFAISLLYAFSLLYGSYRLSEGQSIAKTLNAVVVQQNIDPWLDKDDRIGIRRSQALTDECLLDSKNDVDLVIWSEGVLNHAFPASIPFYTANPEENPLLPYIANKKIPFLIGGSFTVTPPEVKPRRHSNVALLFDENAEIQGYHAKIHLVPFGEYIPLPNSQEVKTFLKKVFKISAGWIPGKEPHIFTIPTSSKANANEKERVSFSTPICFEDAFSDICRKMFFMGSEVFLNITNDSWSMMPSAEYQHLAIATYRSIEFRQTMVRATNSGCSVLILPTGEVKELLPLFKKCATNIEIPIYERKVTSYALTGDLFAYAIILFCLVIIVFSHFFPPRSSY